MDLIKRYEGGVLSYASSVDPEDGIRRPGEVVYSYDPDDAE